MSFRSCLVRDEQNRVCLQIDMEGHIATHPLPDGFGLRSDDMRNGYLQEVVPLMIRRLIEEKNTTRRKISRKVADAD